MASFLSKKKKKKKKNREKYRLSDLKTIGLELLSSRAKINNLPLLLTFVSPTSRPQYALEALLFLQAFFTPLLPLLPPSSYSTNTTGTAQDDHDFIYRTWIRSKFDEFLNSLIDISVSLQSEEALREVVLDTIMEFVKVGNGGRFHSAIYHRLPLPLDVYKEVLVTLHEAVIPRLSNPVVLCDFLTRSYDIGGVISVMALSSLYILMTQHGLEYPNFYKKLYALLVPSIFMAKHRAKFFELLDSCLKSPLLPAYLAAAVTKKLSRLSLSVPPSGGLVIFALIHNLLRRHPSIN